MTYMYYSFIGCFITVSIGWTISYFTNSESDLYDENLIHPIARKMANLFPGKKRRYTEKTHTPMDKARNSTTTSLQAQEKRMGSSNSSLNPAFVHDVQVEPMDGVYKTKL